MGKRRYGTNQASAEIKAPPYTQYLALSLQDPIQGKPVCADFAAGNQSAGFVSKSCLFVQLLKVRPHTDMSASVQQQDEELQDNEHMAHLA